MKRHRHRVWARWAGYPIIPELNDGRVPPALMPYDEPWWTPAWERYWSLWV